MKSGKGDELPWVVGETRRIEGEVALYFRGYHSSPTILDALGYAPGPVACVVEVSEPVGKDSSKQVSRTRTLIAALDATRVLHEFTCRVAEDVLSIFENQFPNDKRPREVIETKRKWLMGTATNEELAAAGEAARDAYSVVGDRGAAWAAYCAAWAVYCAASGAVCDAAWAARVAACATWATAYGTARAKYDSWLDEMLREAGIPI